MGSEQSAEGGLFAFLSHLCTVETSFSPSIIHSLITPERLGKKERAEKEHPLNTITHAAL